METSKIIETLKHMEDTAWALFEMFERDGEPEQARRYCGEWTGFWVARKMLENPGFAAEMSEIYCKEENKDVEVQ